MVNREAFTAGILPGAPAADAPIEADGEPTWLLRCLGPDRSGLYFVNPDGSIGDADRAVLEALAESGLKLMVLLPPYCPFVGEAARGRFLDQAGIAAERYDAQPGTFYLIGPDRRVIGRWRRLALPAIHSAILAD
ncbi:MAG: hypothetical protein HYR63_16590 [Proteobacteria bacterium]|nr:hypothetical protein [Pseudomonadota bacterium]MBI3497688.1 hypothetical protein [Pseudomonadota bacterium]